MFRSSIIRILSDEQESEYLSQYSEYVTDSSLVGKPEGGQKRRWIDNTKIDLLQIGLSVADWIGLAQDRYRWRALVNSVMNVWVPLNAGNLASGCTTCGLSSGIQIHRVS
jgi:hypothetical protein